MVDDRLDAFDPRFGDAGDERADVDRRRTLVKSRGPGPSHEDRKVRILRVAIPLLALAGLLTVVAVFFSGLDPGGSSTVVGPESAVRAAVADRPYRVCFNDANPCAWLTVVDDEIVAFNTNGPLAEEYGRQGVGWCPSSGYFGANSTGSVWDRNGLVVEGPAPRSLDRFDLDVNVDGDVVINFAALNAGLAEWQVDAADITPPLGPPCAQIPFDRAPDLVLGTPPGQGG